MQNHHHHDARLMPISRVNFDKPKVRIANRRTTVSGLAAFNVPATPPLPLTSRSFSDSTTAQHSRGTSGTNHMFPLDGKQGLNLRRHQISGEATQLSSRSFLPSFLSVDVPDDCSDGNISDTPSLYDSSSLRSSEVNLEFPRPPLSPIDSDFVISPRYSEEETCRVRNFLRKRWGTIGSTVDEQVPDSLPVSIIGDGGECDPMPTELADYSWEAQDKHSEEINEPEDGTDNILGKLGLLDNSNVAQAYRSIPVIKDFSLPYYVPQSDMKRPSEQEGTDEVSIVLSALRSSCDLDSSGERQRSTDDEIDRDKALRDELRIRLRRKGSTEITRPFEYSNSCASKVAPLKPIRTSSPKENRSWAPLSVKQSPEIHTPQPSSDFGEVRISQHYSVAAKLPVQMGHGSSNDSSLAFVRLGSSISKLQAHSPHLSQRSQSYSPAVPPKDKLDAFILTPGPTSNPIRRSGILKKRPEVDACVRNERLPEIPKVRPQIVRTRSVPKLSRDRQIHTRSTSAPEAPVANAPLAPAFCLRQLRSAPSPANDNAFKQFGTPFNIPPPPPPPLYLKTNNTEGLRSFMDITPEKPRNSHTRSRSSLAGAAAQAEKARKLLVRASNSVANWGKVLARSSSRKS